MITLIIRRIEMKIDGADINSLLLKPYTQRATAIMAIMELTSETKARASNCLFLIFIPTEVSQKVQGHIKLRTSNSYQKSDQANT